MLVPFNINERKIVEKEKLLPRCISRPIRNYFFTFLCLCPPLLVYVMTLTKEDSSEWSTVTLGSPKVVISNVQSLTYLPAATLHRCFGNPLYCEVLCQDLLSNDMLLFHVLQKEEEENSKWETLSGKLSFPEFYPGPAAEVRSPTWHYLAFTRYILFPC